MADAMQKKLQKLVKQLREEEIDLKETPALFTWRYEDDPWISYELLIKEVDESLMLEEEVMH